MWEQKLISAGIFRPRDNINQIQQYIFRPSYQNPSKFEYSPYNTANQNIEEYKRPQMLEKQILYYNNNTNTQNMQETLIDNNNNNVESNNQSENLTKKESEGMGNNSNKDSNKNSNKELNNKEKKDKKAKKKKKEEEKIEDPDEMLFQNAGEKKDGEKKDEDDENSELSECSENYYDVEKDYNEKLLAQYESVKRIKNKWKINLKGCVVQKDNEEYICSKIHGELSRDW